MGLIPEAPFGRATSAFLAAWASFTPCDSTAPRHLTFHSLR